jgi:hypothetical protein
MKYFAAQMPPITTQQLTQFNFILKTFLLGAGLLLIVATLGQITAGIHLQIKLINNKSCEKIFSVSVCQMSWSVCQ